MKTIEDNAPDINALFAAVNDLPEDDPLREPAPQPALPPDADRSPGKCKPIARHHAGRRGRSNSALPRTAASAATAKGRDPDRRRSTQGSRTGGSPRAPGDRSRGHGRPGGTDHRHRHRARTGARRRQRRRPQPRGLWCAARDNPTSSSHHSSSRSQLQSITDMHWNELIAEITAVGASGGSTEPVTGIEYDSRRIKPGAVFVAMKGGSTDGNRYIDKAIANGALGVITDSSHDLRSSARVSRGTCPCSRSNTGAARWPRRRRLSSATRAQAGRHRHHRHQRKNHHRLS